MTPRAGPRQATRRGGAGGDPPDARGEVAPPRRPAASPPLDVDAELAALTQPAAAGDPACARRSASSWSRATSVALRQGKEPLDVEAEVERQLRELGG